MFEEFSHMQNKSTNVWHHRFRFYNEMARRHKPRVTSDYQQLQLSTPLTHHVPAITSQHEIANRHIAKLHKIYANDVSVNNARPDRSILVTDGTSVQARNGEC